MKHKFAAMAVVLTALNAVFATSLLAGQGAQRMLYTVSTNSFIENVSGDSVVTISDTSGSVSTLQTRINSARSANPNSIIIIHLLSGATYQVNNSSGGLVLSSQECLIGSGALIEAANSAVTNHLVTISSGSTNVSVAGGTLDAAGANVFGIYAVSSSARINIDKVTVRNCGQDCIQLNGQGDTTYDNEMTVTRCDASGSPGHAGISIWNATQAVCVDNNCHNNSVGIWLGNCGDSTIANNTCENNGTGIDMNSGNENNIANNTCNNNGTGILDADSDTMVASDSLGSNTVAGINSTGSGNFFIDNLFTGGNATNFTSAGSGNYIVPYQGALSAPGQNYFYPPLISNQHTNMIVNGMGRFDLTDNSTTTIDTIQGEYNAAISANPGDVIVLHLNGTYTVGANPLTLYSNTCVLLGGTIQINSNTTASTAIQSTNHSQVNISISGGTIDGGNLTKHNAISMNGSGMVQVDGMTLQNFGPDNPRVGNSDVIHFNGESNGGKPPYIVTRCLVNGGAARGIWSQNDGIRGLYSDNTVSNVNMDGVDCDSGTSGALVKFNNLSGNVRYGVFFEQRDKYDVAIGNICNNDGRDLNDYNNNEPGSPVEYNSDICNSCLGGGNGMRSGSTGVNGGSDSTNTLTSHNFFFNNVVQGSTGDGIEGDPAGTQNYYSQNYLAANSTEIKTSGSEAFFNSPDVDGFEQIQNSKSGFTVVVTNASTSQGAAVILGPANTPGSGQWSLIPTDSGYYQIRNKNSGMDAVVHGASTASGAAIIQWAFGSSGDDQWMPVSAGDGLYYFLNRHSGLVLDAPTGAAGIQLDQQPYNGGANQQFSLVDGLTIVPAPSPALITSIGVNGTTLTLTATNGAAGGRFVLLGTTNLLLPLNQWTPILTNNFDGNGNLNLSTNVVDPKTPLTFYLLQMP
jgi:parallel beta-helix repeat protein